MNTTQEGLPWEINDEGDKVCIGAEGDDWLLLTRRDLEQMLDAVRKELAEERAESWALWEFVRRYDEWAESDEQCGGPLFDAMLEMRGNLDQPKPHSHEEEVGVTEAKKKVDTGRLMDGLVQLIQERNRLAWQKERMEEALRIVSRGMTLEDKPTIWLRIAYQEAIVRLVKVARLALEEAAPMEEE